MQLPVIDIRPLIARTSGRCAVAAQIGQACREHGFFYVLGHGVDEGLQERLLHVSRQFFAQPLERKMEIRMVLGRSGVARVFPRRR